MTHTFYNQFVHVLCLTKNLECSISNESQIPMYGYIGAIVKNLGGQLIARAGTSNHVHLLLNIPTSLSISELLNQIKSNTSKWYRKQHIGKPTFAWTEGYCAFTVSPSSLDNVRLYFSNETTRHRTVSPENELLHFLNAHSINFNPQYFTNTTYTRIMYHLIWSVKDRKPLLDKSFQQAVHEKIRLAIQKKGGKLHAIGNVYDHIHLLVECPSTIATSALVMNIKTTSTHFIKTQNKRLSHFSWQEGYDVYSVGFPAQNAVTNYVNNQEDHHRVHTFEDEWQRFLKSTSFA